MAAEHGAFEAHGLPAAVARNLSTGKKKGGGSPGLLRHEAFGAQGVSCLNRTPKAANKP